MIGPIPGATTPPLGVDLDAPCILWTGSGAPGYGRLRWQGRRWLAHRALWTIVRGPIPDGLYVLHACDNPPCVNVRHLFLGTQLDNIRDASRKGRMHPGSRHGNAKLTEPDVLFIRSLAAQGIEGAEIARQAGIHKNTVYHILKGRTWSHV